MAQFYRFTDENGVVRLMAEMSPTPSAGRGAEIYLTGSATLVFAGAGALTVPFDHTEVDTNGIADLANNRLVIPAGMAGLWSYGFTCGVSSVEAAGLEAELSVSGNPWNLWVNAVVGAAEGCGLVAQGLDTFAAGNTLGLTLNSTVANTLTALNGSAPWLMYAFYHGTV